MNAQILEIAYKGNRLRYYVFDNNKILFNAEDLYKVCNIMEPVEQTEEDLAGAILLASGSDADFGVWLVETFSQYADEALVRPSDLTW